jgi:hypothetical protein
MQYGFCGTGVDRALLHNARARASAGDFWQSASPTLLSATAADGFDQLCL